MLKRRGPSSEHDYHDFACTCKRARPPATKRHLYLALDDRDRGYSLYKLDVLDAADADQAERPLPEPPVLRLEVPESGDACHFAALGTKIIAFSNRSPPLVHDALTGALTIGSRRPPRALSRFPSFTVAAGGRLLALPHARRWAWSPADSSSPVPFDPRAVACHAVHPDGRTVFVSAQRRAGGAASWLDHGTFSLDTGGLSGEWTRHGGWLLPFKGQAFFEPQLDAWVGLDGQGHLCSCDGVSRRGTRAAAPVRKVCEDTPLLLDPDSDGKRDAVLTHMGDARFCVVERAARDGGGECVLRVTTFAVRYGKHGELKIADRRLVGSYLAPRHNVFFKVQAFFL
ncbi:hypothetical protein BRADI_4g39613v3 [Brachypodium distachyon]|uniref:DUF1618 domain-containing protein n=1 Tax=Brachypodium distachyon TaxID=15368 RepID=A0A0Q3HTY3_BRADI|nr:hypothetical protein BRADI_4g39613v3 [Brachypodium distachyon]